MGQQPILYSTNTFLAYRISEKYYRSTHYFWCAPYFDPRQASSLAISQPPTSSPAELYEDISKDIVRNDNHSPRVAQNRSGILTGATAYRDAGKITGAQFDEIVEIVRAAQLQDFKPLLFVGPYARLRRYLKPVPVPKRAHPFSTEYIAEGVPHINFDVIVLPWRL